MGSSMFDDIMAGAVVAKHLFRGASKAYVKAKQVAESEKGQQLKAELRAKTSEALDLAGEKAKEMGLEAKAKYVIDFAKEMVLNTSEPMSPDAQVIVYGPGGYRFNDFLKIGLLMNIIILIANIFIVNVVYPLTPLP